MHNSATSRAFFSPSVARIAPFAVFIGFIALQSVAGDLFRSIGIDPRWLYPARTVVVAVLLLALWPHFTELRDSAGFTWQRMLIAIASGFVVFVLWINLDFDWAVIAKPLAFDPTRPDGSGYDWTLIFFRVIGIALVVPVMEELFWRSFLLRWIDRHDFLACDPAKVGIRAILLSALLFGSEHNLWLAGIMAGLVYSYVYIRSGNLWLPIASHATTNGALAWWILATGQWQFW